MGKGGDDKMRKECEEASQWLKGGNRDVIDMKKERKVGNF
jgi:hypothetical protein